MPGRVSLPGGAHAIAVSAGDSHSAALDSGGSVHAWGTFRDQSGPMGFSPEQKFARSPVTVYSSPSDGPPITAIASGSDHVLMLRSDGIVLSMGVAEKGRLGRVPPREALVKIRDAPKATQPALLARALRPAPVPGLPPIGAIGYNAYGSFFIAKDPAGGVFACGVNNYGQLGFTEAEVAAVGAAALAAGGPGAGSLDDPASPAAALAAELKQTVHAPKRVVQLDGVAVAAVVGAEHHTFVVTSTGAALSAGRPTYGRLGRTGDDVNVASDDHISTFAPVAGLEGAGGAATRVRSIACCSATSAAVAQDGSMHAWGFGSTGMLGKGKDSKGNEDDTDEPRPRLIAPSKHFPAVGGIAVAVGGQHAMWLAQPLGDGLAAEARDLKRERRAEP